MRQEQGASDFVKSMVKRSYRAAIANTAELLEKGPTGRVPNRDEDELHKWYMLLDENDKAMIQRVIDATAFSAVFGSLVVLDNKYGGYPIEDKLSDFAVCIRWYENFEDFAAERFADEVRINNGTKDLHDLLVEYLDSPE